MMLADESIVRRIMYMISDHPWEGCTLAITDGFRITWMSSAIFSMLITALVLVAVIVPVARRYKYLPTGLAGFLELLVIFVRDNIARPAFRDNPYHHLPFLLTMFVFILGMNLMGMVPLEAVSHIADLPLIGHTATGIPTVCAALGSMALMVIIVSGLKHHARECGRTHHLPMWLCYLASPILWFMSLSPEIPGLIGKLLMIPLAVLELVGAVAKCFSLMVRLCANMLSGHTLLAILMLFVFQAIRAYLETRATQVFFVAPAAILGAVAVNLLELLVALLQAYLFTFLTAMFLGLYSGGFHQAPE